MKRLLIDCRADRVSTAYTVDGKLKEMFIDPTGGGSLVGRIYVGRVQNILSGQFAFVDIGGDKNAFINLPANHGLKKGRPVLMQVYKDADRTKGPYGGQQLKLKGRLVIVFESHRGEIGVSHKITEPAERSRLRGAVYGALEKGYGAIVRTFAEGYPEERLAEETGRLIALHRQITEKAQYARPPALLYPEGAEVLPENMLTDLLSDDIAEIWVSGPLFAGVRQAVADSAPQLAGRVFFYEDEEGPCLFDAFNINTQITKSLEKTYWLPCGGYVTFEQTEACVVVDVNTGSFSGQKDYRAAILQTNVEAAAAIAAQLTLRNLSGMIIIDFIDMKDRKDKAALMDALAREIKKDRIKTEIVGMTELGLVQLTRRKTRPPLARLLEEDCPHCGGRGRITTQTHTKTPG
jgi:ribonuclease G